MIIISLKGIEMGLNSYRNVLLGIAFAALLFAAAVTPSMTGVAYAASSLTVNAYTTGGTPLSMWATIKSGTTTIRSGFTPLTISGTTGATYIVAISNYGSYVFDHWGNGSTGNPRWVTLNGATTATAYYKTSTTTTTSSGTGIKALLPKTGVFVALYGYPSSSGPWQTVYNEKVKHPSVPFVIVFNPSSGPGSYDDGTISSWVNKLRSIGVIALGYTHDDYGSRSVSSVNADADKYKNWYGADGIFIDEFTNRAGYETHYSSITSHAKSIGMKMTMGNPGTDVPKSYIGTVDVINITEGTGYMPISWLQYCVLCTSSGWHYQYDKRNFAYIRYGVSWLDTTFEVNSSQWVGLLYIHSGTDSNGRWFSVPSYFSTEVATLDR